MGDFLDVFKKTLAEGETGSFSRAPAPASSAKKGRKENQADQPFLDVFKGVLAQKQTEDDRVADAASAEKRKENLVGRNEFMRGLLRGIDSMQATYQGAMGMGASLMGDEEAAKDRFRNYQAEMRQASENPATVDQFFSTDPNTGAMGSVGNFGAWTAGSLGAALPSVAESIMSGVAGAAAGAAVVPAPDPADVATVPIGALAGVFGKTYIKKAIAEAAEQYIKRGMSQEVAERIASQSVQKQLAQKIGSGIAVSQTTAAHEGGGMWAEGMEDGKDNPYSALALGQLSGASEAVMGVVPGAIRGFIGRSAVPAVARDFGPGVAAGYAWDLVKSTGKEGVQESFQEFLGSINERINDPDKKVLTRENFMQWAEAGAQGAVVGSLFGGLEVGQTAYRDLTGERPSGPIASPADDPEAIAGGVAPDGLEAIRARRMQLEQLRSKGFVTKEDGKKVGIEGTRKEIAAKIDADIEDLKSQEAEALAAETEDLAFGGASSVDPDQADATWEEELARQLAAQSQQGSALSAQPELSPIGDVATPESLDTTFEMEDPASGVPLDADGNPTAPTDDPNVFVDGEGQEMWGGKHPKDMTLEEYRAFRSKGFEGVNFAADENEVLSWESHPAGFFGGELEAIKRHYGTLVDPEPAAPAQVSEDPFDVPPAVPEVVPSSGSPFDPASPTNALSKPRPIEGELLDSEMVEAAKDAGMSDKSIQNIKKSAKQKGQPTEYDAIKDALENGEFVQSEVLKVKKLAEGGFRVVHRNKSTGEMYDEVLAVAPVSAGGFEVAESFEPTSTYENGQWTRVPFDSEQGEEIGRPGLAGNPAKLIEVKSDPTKFEVNYPDTVSVKPQRSKETEDAPKTKEGGDPNSSEVKQGKPEDQAAGATPSSDSSVASGKPKPPSGYKALAEFTPVATSIVSPDLELQDNRDGIKELGLKQGEAVGYRVYPKRGSTKGGHWQYGTVRYEPTGSHASVELADGTVESVGGSRLIRLEVDEASQLTPSQDAVDKKRTPATPAAMGIELRDRVVSRVQEMYDTKNWSEFGLPGYIKQQSDLEFGKLTREVVDQGELTSDVRDWINGFNSSEFSGSVRSYLSRKDSNQSFTPIDEQPKVLQVLKNAVRFHPDKFKTPDGLGHLVTFAKHANLGHYMEVSLANLGKFPAAKASYDRYMAGKTESNQGTKTDEDAMKALIEAEFDKQMGVSNEPAPKTEKKAAPTPRSLRKDRNPSERPPTKLEQVRDEVRNKKADLYKQFKDGFKNKPTSNLDPALGAIAVKIAIAEIQDGVLTFAAFVENVSANFSSDMIDNVKPYFEMAWRVAHERNMTSDPGGKFDDFIKGRSNGNETGTDGDSPVGDGAGESQGDAAANGDAANEERGAEEGSGEQGDSVLPNGGKTTKRNGRGRRPRNSTDGGADSGGSEQGSADSVDSGGGGSDRSLADQRAVNHVIGPDDNLAVSSIPESFKRNIKALEILNSLEADGLLPDQKQRQALAQYTGWGGLSQALDSIKGERMLNEQSWGRDENWEKKWGPSYVKVKELLSKEDFQAAQDSTENAHYTSKPIIQSLWRIAERLGYSGGRVLELGAGVGHFAGLVPSRVRGTTKFVMVERDGVSSRIAKMLYPGHDVVAGDMEKFKAVPGSVTMGIGNVPFAGAMIADSMARYGEQLNLHNYSIARHLDAVAPGGVVVVISSHSTLDANIKQRKLLATKGEFIGAIRLPNDAFAENAKTEVVTDILMFRRPRQGDPSLGVRFDQNSDVTVKTKSGEDVVRQVNKYFIDNPDMVLGKHSAKGSMYGPDEYTVESTPGDLQEKINAAIERLPVDILGNVKVADNVVSSDATVPFGRLEVRGGKVVMGYGDAFVPLEGGTFDGFPVHLTGKTGVSRAKDYVGLRDVMANVRKVMLSESSTDDDVLDAQRKLHVAYDSYVSEHGNLNTRKTGIFIRDPDYYRVLSLENEKGVYDPESKKIVVTYNKAAIFTDRVLGPQKEPESAETAADAMSMSIAWRGAIDSGFTGKLLGVSSKDAETKLLDEGLAFRNPSTTELEMSDLYLSGNVRSKLEQAKISAAEDPQYERNVEALTKVLPPSVTLKKDTVRLGAAWIPEQTVRAFASQAFGVDVRVSYNANTDSWSVSEPYGISETAKARYQTDRITPGNVLEETLNLRSIKIYDRVETGESDSKGRPKTTQVLNEKETQAAKHRASVLRADFEKWVLEDSEVLSILAKLYNDKYNNFVRTRYKGDFLVLPGSNPEVDLRPYQKDAIWRIINRGTSLLAHAVGSGKTYTMIGAAMEMRRLGLARRPLLVVQNATLGQFSTSFYKMYPNANVLIANKEDLSAGKRQLFLNKIATGNWDAVVMAQSTFDNMASDPEVERAFIQDQLDLLEDAIREEGGETTKTPTVKQLVRNKKSLKNRFDSLIGSRAKKEDNVIFEDLGIDALFLDEAHAYKKPTFTTKLSSLVGLNVESSARSLATTIKVRSIQSAHNGRNVVLATGTPVTNTLGEAWHMVNYVSPATNAAFSSRTFDQFIGNFAQVEPTLTMNAGGQYVYKDAIVKFRNGQQLVEYINDSWDIVTPDALRAYMEKSNQSLPQLRDGKLTAITVDRTPGVANFMDYISRVYARYKSLTAKQRREMSFIPAIAYGASKAATLDIRLVIPGAAEEKNSKLQRAAEEIKRIYDESSDVKGAQLFFSDMKNPFNMSRLRQFMGGETIDAFTEDDVVVDDDGNEVAEDDNESGSFLYQELRKKLLAMGIPNEQIAFISDAKTDKQRQALFQRVNNGDIRVLIGSTSKMGIGVNVQEKLIALHHFDTPWLPADLEQREGRILRFGNQNKVVEILRYAMKRTLDGAIYMGTSRKQKFIWQVLNGQLDGDSFEDPSSAAMLSIEEQLAAIQDDPVFFEKIEVQNRLRELDLERQSFYDAQQRVASSLSSFKSGLRQEESIVIPRLQKRLERVKGYEKDGTLGKFTFKHGNTVFDDPKEAHEFVKEKVNEVRKYVMDNFDSAQTIWKVGGIQNLGSNQKVNFRVGPFGVVIAVEPVFVTEQDATGTSITRSTAKIKSMAYLDMPMDTFVFYDGTATTPLTILEKAQSLSDEITGDIARSNSNIERARKKIVELEGLTGKQWEDQAEYDINKSRLAEIEAQMLASGGSLSSGQADPEETPSEEERDLGDELGGLSDTLYQSSRDDVSASMRSQAISIAVKALNAGITTYDQLVAFSVKTIGEAGTRTIGPYLNRAGVAAGMKGVRPTNDILGIPGVTREQFKELARDTFGTLTEEKVEVGVEIANRVALGWDGIGFAPPGSPVPGQGLMQLNDAREWLKASHPGQTTSEAELFGGDTLNTLYQANSPRWYLKSRSLVQDKMGQQATSEQVMGMLRKNGVNEDELYWSGLEELLGDKPTVTKAEVLTAIDNGAKVGEVVLPYVPPVAKEATERLKSLGITIEKGMDGELEWQDENGDLVDEEYLDSSPDYERRAITSDIALLMDNESDTFLPKYSGYTTPGGKEYKELLITFPSTERSEYMSSHWDEPNVLAHLRFNERMDADGKRVMFIEEVQSDWHQEGRRKGYSRSVYTPFNMTSNFKGPDFEKRKDADNYVAKLPESVRVNVKVIAGHKSGTPDAPFKKSWPALAIKRAIQYASENGFDRIAWLGGEQQADRYDLSEQIDSVTARRATVPGEYSLLIKKDGETLNSQLGLTGTMSPEKMEETIGKELASRIVKDLPPIDTTGWTATDGEYGWSVSLPNGKVVAREMNAKNSQEAIADAALAYGFDSSRVYEGVDLKVGGEGMKAFYDKILPNEVNKLIKKFGAKVSQTVIETKDGEGDERTLSDGTTYRERLRESVPSFDITPAMRESAITKGQSLFQNQKQGDEVKGWTSFISATRAIIGATDKADVSTFIHELFHPMRRFLLDRSVDPEVRYGITDEDIQNLEDYSGVVDGVWTVDAEERAAKAWEQYFMEGIAPKNAGLESLFEKLSRWMHEIYQNIQYITGKPLPLKVRKLFDKMMLRNGGANAASVDDGGSDSTLPPFMASKRPPDNLYTSIANQIVNELRALRGIPELADVAPESFEEWLSEASMRLTKDPMLGDRLVKELTRNARVIDKIETAVLEIHYQHLNNLRESAQDRLFEAKENGDSLKASQARFDADQLANALEELENATKKAGSEQGRSLVSRRIALRKDFSLVSLRRKARTANAGEELGEKQKEVDELAERIAKIEDALAKAEQENADLKRQQATRKGIDDDKKQVGTPAPKSAAKKNAASKAVEFVKSFANVFGIKPTGTDTLQQTEDERMVSEAEPIVQAYVDAGIYSFGEFLVNFKRDIGSDLPMQAQLALKTAWDRVKSQGSIPAPPVDRESASSMTRFARRIQRSLVESGITELEEVVSAVQESLAEMGIDLTTREVMDALSGYGQFTLLSQEDADVVIRRMNAQLLLKAKIDDVKSGVPAQKSGFEREEATPEIRELMREYNEAKKNSDLYITDRDTQLKTSVGAAITATANRIFDLKKAIAKGEPIVRTSVDLTGKSDELDKLRKELAEQTAIYRAMFPRPGATEAQRLAAAIRGADMAIEAITNELKTGDVFKQGRKDSVSSAELDAKRYQLEALRKQRDVMRDLQKPSWRAEHAEKAYVANLEARIADWKDRMIHSYFDAKPKKEPKAFSERELKLKKELQDAKTEFYRLAGLYRLEHMSPMERAWDWVKETTHLSRAVMTSIDLSAVFRQGGIASFSHPKLAAQASQDMYRAARSAQKEFDVAEKIRNHKNYSFAIQAGLSITTDEEAITRQEEAYMGRWAKHGFGKKGTALNKASSFLLVPISASARSYTTFLNSLRFALFNHFVSTLGAGGQVTLDEAKVLSTFINVATGRADLGKWNQAAANASVLFFAPRYVLSRVQYLAMPFYVLPDSKISGRVRKLMAIEYGKYAVGMGTFMATVVALGRLLADDEEEWPTIEFDPRSSDLWKIKIGDTRIDPMSGLSQIVVFPSQVLSGQKKGLDGQVKDLRGENHKWDDPDNWEVISGFFRKKFAPIPGAIVNTLTGEDVIGDKVTPFTATRDLFVPLSMREVWETMSARDMPSSAVVSALALLGMGGGTYGPKSKYRTSNETERAEQFKKGLEAMEWDSPDPAYKDFLTAGQLKQVEQRREERKQILANSALLTPSRKDFQSDDSFAKAVSERDKALEQLKKSGMTAAEVRKLVLDYWKRNNKSPYEVKGGNYVIKEAVAERLRQIRKVLGGN